MSIFLNRKFATKDSDVNFNEEIIDFAYLAKSIIKLQNLGVLQCDFVPTIGTSSLNHIDRFYITFFGQKLLEYIDIDEKINRIASNLFKYIAGRFSIRKSTGYYYLKKGADAI